MMWITIGAVACIIERIIVLIKLGYIIMKRRTKQEAEPLFNPSPVQEDCKEEIKPQAGKKNPFVITKVSSKKQSDTKKNGKRIHPESEAISCNVCYKTIEVQGVIECCKHEFCLNCITRWSKVGLIFT